MAMPLEDAELVNAMSRIQGNSCPSPDGLPKAFYEMYWDVISPALAEGFREIWEFGAMPKSLNEAMIYLIPKGDTTSNDIGQWRPITILNIIYKIFSNVQTDRIKLCMMDVIYESQTRFMKSRSIMDNVILFWEALATARATNQKLAIVLLDFEKANDYVQWDYLEMVLVTFGFPPAWRRASRALYHNGVSRLLIAGRKGTKILLI